MKKLLICSVLLTLLGQSTTLQAQDTLPRSIHKTWVVVQNDFEAATTLKGYLNHLGDNSIRLASQLKSDQRTYFDIPVESIINIKVRKTKPIVRIAGTLFGAGLGAFAGSAVSRTDINCNGDPYCHVGEVVAKRFLLIPAGTLLGGVVGYMVTNANVKISINRSPESYRKHRAELQGLLLK